MSPSIRILYEKLERLLDEIPPKGLSIIQQAEESAKACREVLKELKLHILNNPFGTQQEEIEFFKTIRPKFYCRFIFHVKVFTIETNRPTGSKKTERKHFQDQLRRIQYFFQNNQELYKYYRSAATHFDELFFTRDQFDVKLLSDDLALTVDQDFCTLQSYKLAKLLANELLQAYIQQELLLLESKNQPVTHPETTFPFKPMPWSATKASLIELIYALYSYGAFSNGKVGVNEIALFFEQACQVKLGNYYRTFQEIRLRKKGRTSFLRQLIEAVEKRMDEMDENPRF